MDSIISPGSITIKAITLISPFSSKVEPINIANIIEEVNVYEHLNQPFMTADFLVNDASSVFTRLGMTGEEFIYVNFTVDLEGFRDEPIERTFRIMSIQKITPSTSPRRVNYIIRAADPEYFNDLTQNVITSYSNMPVSQMATELFNKFLKIKTPLRVANTTTQKTIVIPNMKPSQAMNFLCREAKSVDSEVSNYVFYSNADGFWFSPLENVINKKPMDTYLIMPKNLNIDLLKERIKPKSGKPLEWMLINSYSIPQIFNLEDNLQRGVFDVTLHCVNPIYQRFESKHYNYLEDYNKFHRLDTDNGLKTKFAYMNGDLGKLKGGSHQRYILSDFGELEIKDGRY